MKVQSTVAPSVQGMERGTPTTPLLPSVSMASTLQPQQYNSYPQQYAAAPVGPASYPQQYNNAAYIGAPTKQQQYSASPYSLPPLKQYNAGAPPAQQYNASSGTPMLSQQPLSPAVPVAVVGSASADVRKEKGGFCSRLCCCCGCCTRDEDIEANIQALKTGEHLPLENYIPFRYTEIRDRIIKDYPQVFATPEAVTCFKRFCRWLNLRNQAKLALQYQHLDEMYVLLDPDVDSDGPPPGHLAELWPDKPTLVDAYIKDLQSVLNDSEFDMVTKEDMQKAYDLSGPSGLTVTCFDETLLDVRLWHRGHRIEPVKYRSWRTLYFEKTVEMPVYQRLVMMYRIQPDEEARYRQEVLRKPWYKRVWHCMMCRRSIDLRNNGMMLSSEYLYMRLYKDIQHSDIDMLVPGASVHFTWVDWAFVWIPIAIGVSLAIWKIVKGSLLFDTVIHIVTTLALIMGPLLYGITAYLNIKAKSATYAAYINQLVIMHNICNNESVMYQLLDEAQEQEDSEALLAYFFLLLMQQQSKTGAVSEGDLDRTIEAYLQMLVSECSELDKVRVDFDVSGAVEKLRVYRVLTVGNEATLKDGSKDRNRLLTVKGLHEAEELTHLKNFNELVEVPGLNFGRSGLTAALRSAAIAGESLYVPPAPTAAGAAPSSWREVHFTHEGTGQKCRYFWNESTGETTYNVPPSYIPYTAPPQPPVGSLPLLASAWPQQQQQQQQQQPVVKPVLQPSAQNTGSIVPTHAAASHPSPSGGSLPSSQDAVWMPHVVPGSPTAAAVPPGTAGGGGGSSGSTAPGGGQLNKLPPLPRPALGASSLPPVASVGPPKLPP